MKIALFANTDWYLYNFRLGLAQKLRAAGMEVVLVSPAGTYGDRLRALGFHWEPISMSRRGFNPFREVATLVELWNLLRRLEIDVIHNFTDTSAQDGAHRIVADLN